MRRPVVLVLRGRDAFSDKLSESGCEVVNLELIKTEPVKDLSGLESHLAHIEDLDGLFFTSPFAATVFLGHLQQFGTGFRGKIYVLGQRTKTVFENAGISVEYCDEANTAAEMIASFGDAEFAGKRLLFVRGDKSMPTIPEFLDGKADIAEAVVYKTIEKPPDPNTAAVIRERLQSGEIDWVCFFSPFAVQTFQKIFDPADLNAVKTAVIGRTTAQRAQELGLSVNLISKRARTEDFAADLIQNIKRTIE